MLETIKQNFQKFMRILGYSRSARQLYGSQRSVNSLFYNRTNYTDYDLEIEEFPIREPDMARALIEMRTYCYEVINVLRVISQDIYASPDGSDRGWKISDFLSDGVTKVNSETYDIIANLCERKQGKKYLVGGKALQAISDNTLLCGDSFVEVGLSRVKGKLQVSELLLLPTWEVFIREDDQGRIIAYEQRRYLSERPGAIQFPPYKIAHFCFNRYRIYGQSLFAGGLEAWHNLKILLKDLPYIRRSTLISPRVHEFSEGISAEQIADYKAAHEYRNSDEVITDYFTLPGQKITSIPGYGNNLDGHLKEYEQLRGRLIPADFPAYRIPGLFLENSSSREISGQPSQNYKRLRYEACSVLTEGLRQIIDIEIIAAKGFDWWERNGKYSIEWPAWKDNLQGGSSLDDRDLDEQENSNNNPNGVNNQDDN